MGTATIETRPKAAEIRRPRMLGIDAVRILGAAAVVWIHVGPWRGPEEAETLRGALSDGVVLLCRFAVPFFFVASGYFYVARLVTAERPWGVYGRFAGRISGIFLSWSAIYVIVPAVLGGLHHGSLTRGLAVVVEKTAWAVDRPVDFILEGPQEHLWFLPALILAAGLVTACVAWRVPERLALGGAIGLYILGLSGGAYRDTPIGLDLGCDPRNGPFAAFLLVWAGTRLARAESIRARTAVALVVAGLIVQVAEALALRAFNGADPASHDVLLGTAPLGVGVFLTTLVWPRLGGERIAALGSSSLGVYTSHMLVALVVARGTDELPDPLGPLLLPVAVFLGALVFTELAKRWRWTRPLVV